MLYKIEWKGGYPTYSGHCPRCNSDVYSEHDFKCDNCELLIKESDSFWIFDTEDHESITFYYEENAKNKKVVL